MKIQFQFPHFWLCATCTVAEELSENSVVPLDFYVNELMIAPLAPDDLARIPELTHTKRRIRSLWTAFPLAEARLFQSMVSNHENCCTHLLVICLMSHLSPMGIMHLAELLPFCTQLKILTIADGTVSL